MIIRKHVMRSPPNFSQGTNKNMYAEIILRPNFISCTDLRLSSMAFQKFQRCPMIRCGQTGHDLRNLHGPLNGPGLLGGPGLLSGHGPLRDHEPAARHISQTWRRVLETNESQNFGGSFPECLQLNIVNG